MATVCGGILIVYVSLITELSVIPDLIAMAFKVVVPEIVNAEEYVAEEDVGVDPSVV